MFEWLKNYYQKKKEKRIKDARTKINKINKYCDTEEDRLRDLIVEQDKIAQSYTEEDLVFTRCKLRQKIYEDQADLIKRYIKLLRHEVSNVEMHHTTRELVKAMGIGDDAKF